jgi:tetratricopeptide (TPR) repeat protein
MLARALLYKHERPEAIAQLQKLLLLDPKDRDAALNLGQLLSAEKRYPEAMGVAEGFRASARQCDARQPESFVVCVSSSDHEAASIAACLQIKDTEHLYTIFRHGKLFADDRNLAVTQCLDQGFDGRSVRDRNMRCCRRVALAPAPTPPA